MKKKTAYLFIHLRAVHILLNNTSSSSAPSVRFHIDRRSIIRHPTMAHLTASTGSALLRFLRRPAHQCAFKSTSTTTTSTAVPDLDIEALATAQASQNAADQPALQYDPEHELREQQIERSRNKSRLLPQHRNMLNDRVPYAEPQSWIHNTVKYARMQFGRHGTASGIDARVCFATAAEQATRAEWERVAFPDDLPTVCGVLTFQTGKFHFLKDKI